LDKGTAAIAAFSMSFTYTPILPRVGHASSFPLHSGTAGTARVDHHTPKCRRHEEPPLRWVKSPLSRRPTSPVRSYHREFVRRLPHTARCSGYQRSYTGALLQPPLIVPPHRSTHDDCAGHVPMPRRVAGPVKQLWHWTGLARPRPIWNFRSAARGRSPRPLAVASGRIAARSYSSVYQFLNSFF
jgi:hypothetical protein